MIAGKFSKDFDHTEFSPAETVFIELTVPLGYKRTPAVEFAAGCVAANCNRTKSVDLFSRTRAVPTVIPVNVLRLTYTSLLTSTSGIVSLIFYFLG
jgi:hypothetical protein